MFLNVLLDLYPICCPLLFSLRALESSLRPVFFALGCWLGCSLDLPFGNSDSPLPLGCNQHFGPSSISFSWLVLLFCWSILPNRIFRKDAPKENLFELIHLLQYFGHLMRITDSLEKVPMLGKIEGSRRRG